MPLRRTAYSLCTKKKAVLIAEQTNNCNAARQFGVSEKLICDWREVKASGKWKNVLEVRKKIGNGRREPLPELEKDLVVWFENHLLSAITMDIRRKAKVLGQQPPHAVPETFKFGHSWCYNFMKRHRLIMRERTTLAQRLPDDLTDEVLGFQRFIIRCRSVKANDIPLSLFGNMDEVAMNFDMPTKRTMNDSIEGVRSILVRTTGHEKSHFTAVMSCTGDGNELPTVVILKRKMVPKFKVSDGVLLRVHPKSWMDRDGMHDWVKSMWLRRPGALLKQESLLVMDSFAAHKAKRVKTRLNLS